MHNYKDLRVWKSAIELATDVYAVTSLLPKEEKFGLISQIQRSVVSIASNIAEGAGRNGKNEFKMFLGYALGSAFELETQIIIATKLKYISEEKSKTLLAVIDNVQKMTNGLLKSLSSPDTKYELRDTQIEKL